MTVTEESWGRLREWGRVIIGMPRERGSGREPYVGSGAPKGEGLFLGGWSLEAGSALPWHPESILPLGRYQEEARLHATAENDFVLLKKVRWGLHLEPDLTAWSPIHPPGLGG